MPENFSYLANFAKLWHNFWSRAKPKMIIRIPQDTDSAFFVFRNGLKYCSNYLT